jgi:imidazole glycerol-phosphate synthase subunit HisH
MTTAAKALDVALLDYGAGNLHSLGKALERGGARVTVTTDWDRALAADALVLPGVGAFSAAVEALPSERARVREALEGGLPCLGICLGMQLFFDGSDEGEGEGIGFIPGRVRRLEAPVVPHMGWNDVEDRGDPLFGGDARGMAGYYAHSYQCDPQDQGAVIAWTEYAGTRIAAAVRRGRSWGVQFHPEKSSRPGLRLLANFLEEARR